MRQKFITKSVKYPEATVKGRDETRRRWRLHTYYYVGRLSVGISGRHCLRRPRRRRKETVMVWLQLIKIATNFRAISAHSLHNLRPDFMFHLALRTEHHQPEVLLSYLVLRLPRRRAFLCLDMQTNPFDCFIYVLAVRRLRAHLPPTPPSMQVNWNCSI